MSWRRWELNNRNQFPVKSFEQSLTKFREWSLAAGSQAQAQAEAAWFWDGASRSLSQQQLKVNWRTTSTYRKRSQSISATHEDQINFTNETVKSDNQ